LYETANGTVTTVTRTAYEVRLGNGHVIRATLSGKMDRAASRAVGPGDRVSRSR
jgi:translation initiation factor IF-1